jgi:hypothetical protein
MPRIGDHSTTLQEQGRALARRQDDKQAEFLRAFLQEMLSWGNFEAQMQLHYVNKHLTDEERELVSCLGMTEC